MYWLYCCIAIQRARDNASALYCPIQQVFTLYCCRARCIGFALHWRGDGGHGWSDRHVPTRGGVKTAAYCIPLHTCILHTVAYLLHTCIPPPHTECAAYPVCSKKLHTVLHTRCVSAQAHELWDMVGDACLVSVVSPYVPNASPCSQMAVPITGVHH